MGILVYNMLALVLLLVHSCASLPSDNYRVYHGPVDKRPATLQLWWEEFTQWREDNMARLNLSLYDYKEIEWARTSFIQPQLMIHDRYLYDRQGSVDSGKILG